MTVEILFGEICNYFGDPQNARYLRASCPSATFVETCFDDTPYFVSHEVDFLLMGAMSESTQRRVLEKLRPYADRLRELRDKGTVMLFTGNAGDIFCRKIDYVTEKISVEGLGFFPMDVRTDWFKRVNGKIIGMADSCVITGFRSQFAQYVGDNSTFAFVKVERGFGTEPGSLYEGMREKNLICTQIIGPILPNNPLFTTYLIGLAGGNDKAAFYDDAMAAWQRRVEAFRNPSIKF